MDLNNTKHHAIGIDLGGTKIEAALISSHGEVIDPVRFATPDTPEKIQKALLDLIDNFAATITPKGVGFSIPGSLDPKTMKLRNAPNSPAINNTVFFKILSEKIKYPTRFENDANCLVLSEKTFGVAQNHKNVVGLIMGTGFGSGVIIDNKLVHGSQKLAPEIGHTTLCYEGRPCLCGKKGCIETYLSGPAILARYHEAGGNPSLTDTKNIFEHAHKDKIAHAIIKETLSLFCHVMANIVSLYDPEVIVLGGGLSLQNVYYEQEKNISALIFGSEKTPEILKAQHGDASGKLGAASLFF